ncbi:MAG: aminoacyl-tRNA hydrolase [Candidatus Levybacteria bacterium]|nr:aminoacyl-tRNA hydrolase [Candidatus Levybacteria bacterium]
MKLIVGLGNPGERYQKTRHNIGFMVVEQFLKDFESAKKTVWANEIKFKSDIVEFTWQPKHGVIEKVVLAKPKTYMNNSGLAVSLLTTYYKLPPSDMWIIHDELDLPLGSMKIRLGGSSAGQNGVDSIINTLKTDKFWRFRMGIGVSHDHNTIGKHMIDKAEDYVLGSFSGNQKSKASALIKRGAKAIATALEEGLDKAMNRFNTK